MTCKQQLVFDFFKKAVKVNMFAPDWTDKEIVDMIIKVEEKWQRQAGL